MRKPVSGTSRLGCLLAVALTLGGSAVARADIPGFGFDIAQVDRNIEIYPSVFSDEFYPAPPCEFEVYRRAPGTNPWDLLYEGALGSNTDRCEPVCFVDEWGEEHCYPPDTKSVCACRTFVDLCPEPGSYEYKLILRDVWGPWGSDDHQDLEATQPATVDATGGECVAPTGAVTGTWWPRVHDDGCNGRRDGCDTAGNEELPHLLVMLIFLAGLGGAAVLRRRRRASPSFDR